MSKEVIPSFPRAILGKKYLYWKISMQPLYSGILLSSFLKAEAQNMTEGVSMSARACFCYAHESIFMFGSKPMPWSPELCFMNWSWELSFPLEFILMEDLLAQDTWSPFFSKVHKKKKKNVMLSLLPFSFGWHRGIVKSMGDRSPNK